MFCLPSTGVSWLTWRKKPTKLALDVQNEGAHWLSAALERAPALILKMKEMMTYHFYQISDIRSGMSAALKADKLQ